MRQQRNIKIINHTDTIDPSKHLNESLFYLIDIELLNLPITSKHFCVI